MCSVGEGSCLEILIGDHELVGAQASQRGQVGQLRPRTCEEALWG